MNSKKILSLLLALFLLVAAVYTYFYTSRKAKAPVESFQQPSATSSPEQALFKVAEPKASASPSLAPVGVYSGAGSDLGSFDIQVVEIDFDGQSLRPASADIRVGDYVFFKNTGSSSFWPVTLGKPHPGFDAGGDIAPGKQYKFQFKNRGTWVFGEKNSPDARAEVTVH